MTKRPGDMARREEELFALEELRLRCDMLAAQLHPTRTLGAHLLDSTLHHLLAA